MTSVSASRPVMLGLLLLLPACWMAWRRWAPPLPRGRSRASLGLRLVLVTLIVLALADVHLEHRPDRRAVVAVVDLSDSARSARDAAADAVRAMIRAKGPDDLFGVVTFGRDAQVEVSPNRDPGFEDFQTRPDPSFSNPGGALQLAANLIPDGYARQVVLLSDGRQNVGDAAESVSSLRRRSVRTDVVPVGADPGPEAMVAALEAPPELRAGEGLTVTARLRANVAAKGRLSLRAGGRELEARQVDVPAGVSVQTFQLPPPEPGVLRLTAVLDAAPDGYSENDRAEAVVRVRGRPAVLVLEGRPGAGANVRSALEAAGMRVDTRNARDAPVEAGVLAAYDSVVVADAPVDSFPPGALDAIATTVRDLGRGLVAVGGPSSYGPGGWEGTPLEEALPVRMEVPRPKDRPSVAVCVVIETMERSFADAIALGAVESVIDQLTPEDEISVVNMGVGSSKPAELVVPLTRATDKDALKQRVRDAQLGDPDGYAESLAAGIESLRPSTAANKHIVIVGDGDAVTDFGGRGTYERVLGEAARARIVTSAIGVDTHSTPANMDHMRVLAEIGGGAFHLAATASQVPDLLLAQSRAALRPWFELAPFFPEVTSSGDLLAGVATDAFPQLGGYVATTPKPTADVVLSSPKHDPVLVTGQYGLGRSVAWTSDASGRWTADLLASPVSAPLFGRMVGWTLPSGEPDPLRIDATPSGDGLDLVVTGPEQAADLRLRVLAPDGSVADEHLRSPAPGRWEGAVVVGDVGTYVFHASLVRGGAVVGETEVSVPVPYSPEYLELGRDDALLRQFAGQGGAVLARPASAWAQPRLPMRVSSPVFWLLVLVAAVLWPLDIALRRLTLSPARFAAAARTGRRPPATSRDGRDDGRAEPAERGFRRRRRPDPTYPDEAAAPVGRSREPEDALAGQLLEVKRRRSDPGG